MKKRIVKLTESDLERLIQKLLKESVNEAKRNVSKSNLKTIQIDLTTTDKSTRKEIMDRLYGMGYKWNNGFLSINVGKPNKFWKSYKDGNYITDLDYIIIGPYKELKQNEIGHNGKPFPDIDIIKPDEFLNL